MVLHHLCPKPIIKTCPSYTPTMSEKLTADSGKKGNKGRQGLTVPLLAELVHILALPGHISL
jgi:hypothetical protein